MLIKKTANPHEILTLSPEEFAKMTQDIKDGKLDDLNTMTEPRISSFCFDSGCIGISRLPNNSILIQQTGRHNEYIVVTPEEFRAFVEGVKANEFDEFTTTASLVNG